MFQKKRKIIINDETDEDEGPTQDKPMLKKVNPPQNKPKIIIDEDTNDDNQILNRLNKNIGEPPPREIIDDEYKRITKLVINADKNQNKTQNKRCPNGTRRNPITKNCEEYKKK
jgi:hypothetical protein